MTIVKTEPHETQRRIRFGSDGNGIFVAVSADGGATWRHFDRADSTYKAFAVEADLLASEYEAGRRYFGDSWKEWQAHPHAVYVAHFYGIEEDLGNFEHCLHVQREERVSVIADRLRGWNKFAVVFIFDYERGSLGEEIARVSLTGKITVSHAEEKAS